MATAISGSRSIERLRPRSDSNSSGASGSYTYENSLAIADDEVETAAAAEAEAEAEAAGTEPTARQAFELSAAQASCWLRQLLCSSMADLTDCSHRQEAGATEDATDAAAAADAETAAQLEAMFQSFADLPPAEQSLVPEQLLPCRLRLLRARQQAVSACAAEASALARRRRKLRVDALLAATEKLAGCNQRLRLVSRCAAGLVSRLGCAEDAADDVARDLRLLEDSVARARRNIGELEEELAARSRRRSGGGGGGGGIGRTAERLLRRCVRCLAARADGLAAFAAQDGGDGCASSLNEALRGAREGAEEVLASLATRSVSFEPRRLERQLRKIELAGGLIVHAIAANDEATERRVCASFEPNLQTQPPEEEQQQQQQQELQQLQARLSAVRAPLEQLAAVCRSRGRLCGQLAQRTQRLRHLCELAGVARRSLGERLFSGGAAAFLEADEDESARPTTPELLRETSVALDNLHARCRRLAAQALTATADSSPEGRGELMMERRLAAMVESGERLLARVGAAREAFEADA